MLFFAFLGCTLPKTMSEDGNRSQRQEIQAMRENNPDRQAAPLERHDNHVGHGNATKIVSIIESNKLTDASNGTWRDRHQFKRTFCRDGDKHSNPERYTGTKLGKWNQGATESVLKDGDRAKMFHPFDGILMVTELDREDIERDNAYKPNEREATQNELHKFVTVMKMMDPDYSLDSDTGTMTIVENLWKFTPDQGYVDNHIATLCGLYHNETYPDLTIDVYNCVATSFSASEPPAEPTRRITPLDLSFGSPYSWTNEYSIYTNSNGEGLCVQSDEEVGSEWIFKMKLNENGYKLMQDHIGKEEKTFGDQHRKREGHMIYRQGRLVTGSIPKKFGCELTGGDRGKGTRIVWTIPDEYIDVADELFKIGTNKKITDEDYNSWPTFLRKFFDTRLHDAAKEVSKCKERVRDQHIATFRERLDGIRNMNSIEELEGAKTSAIEKMTELRCQGIWADIRNKLYKYVHETYMPALDERITELQREPEEEDEPEHDEDEPEHDEDEPEHEEDVSEEETDIYLEATVKELKEILTEDPSIREQIIQFLRLQYFI